MSFTICLLWWIPIIFSSILYDKLSSLRLMSSSKSSNSVIKLFYKFRFVSWLHYEIHLMSLILLKPKLSTFKFVNYFISGSLTRIFLERSIYNKLGVNSLSQIVYTWFSFNNNFSMFSNGFLLELWVIWLIKLLLKSTFLMFFSQRSSEISIIPLFRKLMEH